MKNQICQHKQSCELSVKRGTAVTWNLCESCPMKSVSQQQQQPVQTNTPNFLKKMIVKDKNAKSN